MQALTTATPHIRLGLLVIKPPSWLPICNRTPAVRPAVAVRLVLTQHGLLLPQSSGDRVTEELLLQMRVAPTLLEDLIGLAWKHESLIPNPSSEHGMCRAVGVSATGPSIAETIT